MKYKRKKPIDNVSSQDLLAKFHMTVVKKEKYEKENDAFKQREIVALKKGNWLQFK